MVTDKANNGTKYPPQKVNENKESSKLKSEIDNLWLGMERRKFSYTIHVPERRYHKNTSKHE
jgi:hypothetical protein